jgi:transcription initiation factor IIE alpha subunit
MSEASVKNWIKLMGTGELENKAVRILDYVKAHPGTDIDTMRVQLDMPHQTITAIISNLMDAGLIKFQGERRKTNDNIYSILFFVEYQFERDQLKQKRLKEKFNLWIEKGLSDYTSLMSSPMIMALTMEKSL